MRGWDVPQDRERPVRERRAGRARLLVADAVRVQAGEDPVDRRRGDVEDVRADLGPDRVADGERADQQDQRASPGSIGRRVETTSAPIAAAMNRRTTPWGPRRRDEQGHRDDEREPGRVTKDADRWASAAGP